MAGVEASSNPNGLVEGAAIVTSGAAPNYGITANTYWTMSAWDALPIDSTFTYAYAFDVNGGMGITRTNASGSVWIHIPLHLPSGALLTKIEFNYCDTGTATFFSFLFRQPKNGAVVFTPLITSSGTPGCVVETATLATPLTIDNDGNSYFLEINMGGNTDSTIIFDSARAGYVLQASPAPATASFNDVPTTHPFFQFIEALKASGITGGCQASPPLYCPDNPVTRGQMAVFLAKALGLHWPN
jgi:hypothetical protein